MTNPERASINPVFFPDQQFLALPLTNFWVRSMIYVEKKINIWNYLRIFLYHPVLDQQIPEPTYELQVNEDQVWGMLRKVAFTEISSSHWRLIFIRK